MAIEPFDESRLADPHRLAALKKTGLLDSPPEPEFDRLTLLAQRTLRVPTVVISLVDDRRQFFKSRASLGEPLALERETPLSHSFCKYVVMSGTPLEVPDAKEHPLVCDNPAIADYQVRSYLGVPIKTDSGVVLGSFCAIDVEPHQWTEEEKLVLMDLAHLVITETNLRESLSEAQTSARLLAEARKREIEVGGAIQKNLLVRQPPENIPGLSFGYCYRASQYVGGDYSDFLVYDNGCVDVLVGDVMGKGVGAALIAAAAKSYFQRAARRLGLDYAAYGRLPEPEEIVNAVHASLTRELIRVNSFVTLLYARFNPEARTVTLVDCGHPRCLHYRGNEGLCEALSGYNVPLGLSLHERYRQVTHTFESGDAFLLYTDGLSEASDEDDEEFGPERLMELLVSRRDDSARDMARHIEEAVTRFGGEAKDDLTCLVVRAVPDDRRGLREVRRLEFVSDTENLDTAREFVETFCQEFCADTLAESEREMIGLAVHEAVTNVVRHAYSTDLRGQVQVDARLDGTVLQFRLRDSGRQFPPPDSIPPPVFDGTRDGGFGLFIVESVMDGVERTRDDMGRNCLTLTRRLDRPGDAK